MEIDKEIKEKIDQLSTIIVNGLYKNSSILINIQIEEEWSQYDVLFSYNFMNLGKHQRGILENDLIIGVVGFGTYGFNIYIPDTDPGYYKEKLGTNSYFLTLLFNSVRKKLSKKS